MRKNIGPFSLFGDPNWAAIDAQISILEGTATYNDFEHEDAYVESEAYRAKEWLAEKHNEDLFDETFF